VEGLTEKQGIQASCAPGNIVYPHKKPALILARKDVGKVRIQQFDWEINGAVTTNYSVTLVLTPEARDQLAAACPGKVALIAVSMDGHYSTISHYILDQDAPVSYQCLPWAVFIEDRKSLPVIRHRNISTAWSIRENNMAVSENVGQPGRAL